MTVLAADASMVWSLLWYFRCLLPLTEVTHLLSRHATDSTCLLGISH
jgi:hypothetical protein